MLDTNVRFYETDYKTYYGNQQLLTKSLIGIQEEATKSRLTIQYSPLRRLNNVADHTTEHSCKDITVDQVYYLYNNSPTAILTLTVQR